MLKEDNDDGSELERLIYQLGRDLPPRPNFSREFPVNRKTFLPTRTTSITGSRCLSPSSEQSESLYKSHAAASCVPICQSIFFCLQSTQLSLKKRNFALFVTSIINFETNFKFEICKKTH